MADHLAADSRLLEDVHRLQQQRFCQADRVCDRGQSGIAREPGEHWVEIVKCVTDLVERQLERLPKPAFHIE
jgi:hypothetical protein